MEFFQYCVILRGPETGHRTCGTFEPFSPLQRWLSGPNHDFDFRTISEIDCLVEFDCLSANLAVNRSQHDTIFPNNSLQISEELSSVASQ